MSHVSIFNGSLLRELRECAGMSRDDLGTVLGVSSRVVSFYESGRTVPPMASVLRIAEFFGARPIDAFFLGSNVDIDAGDVAASLRRRRMEAYELLLVSRAKAGDATLGNVMIPWPYNLLQDMGITMDEPMTQDQLDGLKHVLDDLPERTRGYIYGYYRDGQTMEAIGSSEGLSRERIRQVIKSGLNRLQHPERRVYVTSGLRGQVIHMKALELQLNIAAAERVLRQVRSHDALMEIISSVENGDKLVTVMNDLNRSARELTEKGAAVIESQARSDLAEAGVEGILNADVPIEYRMNRMEVRSRPIMSLEGLSTRSMNALTRSGIITVGAMIDMVASGQLLRVPNLGRISVHEILQRTRAICGENYGPLYGMTVD